MTAHRLQRHGDRDLEFDGRALARASSEETSRDPSRWTELVIYATSTGKWVVHRVGRSTRPEDVDLTFATVCSTPAEVNEALITEGFRATTGAPARYLTRLAQELLETAIAVDPRLTTALVERV